VTTTAINEPIFLKLIVKAVGQIASDRRKNHQSTGGDADSSGSGVTLRKR